MEPEIFVVFAQRVVADSLVGRAQWKINQAPSLKRWRACLEATFSLPDAYYPLLYG